MIGAGVAFVETFHWALYLFGVFLLFTGIKMFIGRKKVVDIARNPLIRLVRRLLPVSACYHGARFTVFHQGRRILTPLALGMCCNFVVEPKVRVDNRRFS